MDVVTFHFQFLWVVQEWRFSPAIPLVPFAQDRLGNSTENPTPRKSFCLGHNGQPITLPKQWVCVGTQRPVLSRKQWFCKCGFYPSAVASPQN